VRLVGSHGLSRATLPLEEVEQVLERRAGGRQVPKEDAAGDRERDLSRQMQVMQQTFSEKIAEEKKKFAQERLLLKQQREMEEMKEEISRLTHKTKQAILSKKPLSRDFSTCTMTLTFQNFCFCCSSRLTRCDWRGRGTRTLRPSR
jgi:hypothetical protein